MIWGNPDGYEIVVVPIKRFLCRSCGRTFGFLPWFLVIGKRYHAHVIQACWKAKVAPGKGSPSLEAISERWWVGSVHTVRRWLLPLTNALRLEVRRLAEEAAPAPTITPPLSPAQEILTLIPRILRKLTVHAEDAARVPYHFALHVHHRLKTTAG